VLNLHYPKESAIETYLQQQENICQTNLLEYEAATLFIES